MNDIYNNPNLSKRIANLNNKNNLTEKDYTQIESLETSINTFLNQANGYFMPGSFYKCRKYGIITRYDNELYDIAVSDSLSTLFFAVAAGKIFSAFLPTTLRYKHLNEGKLFIISTLSFTSIALLYSYFKMKRVNTFLDKKYSLIAKDAFKNINN